MQPGFLLSSDGGSLKGCQNPAAMKKKILIIEDQAPMRRNIALMLQLEGYETVTGENGRAGLEVARKEKPDLILCDVMMPRLDGYGVLQALRADRTISGTPFIFLTARGEKQDQRAGKRTNGIVKDLLTNSASHPHGIKVRLTDGQVGRVQAILENIQE